MKIFNYQTLDENSPVFQTSHNNSTKYKQASTTKIVEYLQTKGWTTDLTKDVSCAQPRKESKKGFQKHIVILNHPELKIDNENSIQLLLTNSHDGSSSVKFNLGVYRTVCANGLVVGDNIFELSLRHSGHNFFIKLEEYLNKITEFAPKLKEKVEKMKNIELSESQQIILAEKVANLVLPETAEEVNLNSVLKIKRIEDNKTDLYTVFNRVQEAALKGGIKYKTFKDDGTSRPNTSRKVKNLKRKIDLNKEIWNFAEKLAA